MPSRKRSRGERRPPVRGVDPHARADSAGADRKTLQLCRQVEQALNLALAGIVDDDVLRELAVIRVEPAPDSGHLAVTVAPVSATTELTSEEAIAALVRASGVLRAEVASSIHRRKTPELFFRLAPPDECR